MKRVALASWSARRVGGVEDYLAMLLPALSGAGIELAFWHEVEGPRNRSSIPVPPGVLDICAEGAPDVSLARLREWKPDVIYSHGVQDPTLEAQLLDVAPSVLFLHTYIGTCISGSKTFTRPTPQPCTREFGWACLAHYFPHGCGGNNPATMWRLFGSQSRRLELLRRYRAVLTHTNHMREELTRHGVPSTVVPYPVACEPLGEVSAADGMWRLLFAGRMEELKGGQYLIEALPEIAAAASRPVRVIFAGDGSDREQWERRARKIEAATPELRVDFTGWVSQREVGALMKDVDLLVVPSLWPEPFGAVGPAAARLGVPAAAFAAGGIPEWLHEGVSGHLAPADPPTPAGLAQAVIRCLEDPRHYTMLTAGARQMGARFTMERHLPVLLSVMSELERA